MCVYVLGGGGQVEVQIGRCEGGCWLWLSPVYVCVCVCVGGGRHSVVVSLIS